MINAINSLREYHGRQRVWNWHNVVCDYCREHCYAMARAGHLYHAEPHLLGEWAECVAVMDYDYSVGHGSMINRIVFDVLAKSPAHLNILLNSNLMACAEIIDVHRLFVTIRGRIV